MRGDPDFFLSAASEMRPESDLFTVRTCWVEARVRDNFRDDYMLVEVDPPVIGQRYGLGSQDIAKLVIAPKSAGHSLFPITYGGVTDTYTYNWQGLRRRAYLAGVYYRYVYNGERVLEELNDSGGVLARYTTENDSYDGMLLHLQRATGESRFPLYDEIGSARALVDGSGAITDSYSLDAFGDESAAPTGTTPNPYRFGAAWGYITDPSGLLQLGARYYWPEVGRFVQRDPARDGNNWYGYAESNPLLSRDPAGLMSIVVPGAAEGLADAAEAIDCAKKKKAQLDSKYGGQKLNDHWLHCVYSCEITRQCGAFAGWAAAVGKEAKDAVGAGDCSWGDLVADKRGIGKASGKDDCEKACDADYARKPPPRPKPDPKRRSPPSGSGGKCRAV